MRDDAECYILQEAARKRRNPVVVGLAAVLPAGHVTSQQRQPVPASQVYPRLRTIQNCNICWRIFCSNFREKTTLTKKLWNLESDMVGHQRSQANNVYSCCQLIEVQPAGLKQAEETKSHTERRKTKRGNFSEVEILSMSADRRKAPEAVSIIQCI